MSRPLIVIADTDEKYLSTLEDKFLRELDDEMELELISSREYFNTFFQTPRTAEILAVCEELYDRDLHRHNINHLFVLAESDTNGSTEELSVNHVYKYTGIKEIYNELTYRSRDKILKAGMSEKDTRVIALYSAIGGSGKTGLGLGLAESLARNHQRVLYINTESIQTYGVYLKDGSCMTNEGIRAIKEDLNHIYTNVRHFVRKEGFAYLPPFQMTLDALNLDFSIYGNVIRTAKESREYDFIIVDIEAGYDRERIELLQNADKVLLILLQDAVSVRKTEYLLQNIEFGDREKYLFICNKYDESKENVYLRSEIQAWFPMDEYVELAKEPLAKAGAFARLKGIQKLAYMFI